LHSTHCSPHSVPCFQFQTLFTLISKYFSSFAHATCSLSVSQPYLALDEFYHPISPGVPTKTTRQLPRNMLRIAKHRSERGSHPLWRRNPTDFQSKCQFVDSASLNYNSKTAQADFDLKFELFGLHSPLLTKSLLISFPRLNDMLKFSR